MSIGLGDLHLYNDTPVIEEGSWKLLAPTKWGVKWRHIPEGPIVIHNCPKDRRNEIVLPRRIMKERPGCGLCNEDVPEGIQAVWQMTHMEEMLG